MQENIKKSKKIFDFYQILLKKCKKYKKTSNCYNNYWTKTLNNVNYFFILTFSAIISGHVPIRL
ncbi:hypothetical protein B1134_11055 [Enterococcus faecium]|nr:hypothetical protein B1134_11055 [Enterococcus faecium]